MRTAGVKGRVKHVEDRTSQRTTRSAVAIKEQRVLQSEFRSELELVIECDLGDEHFDEHHRLLAVEPFDHLPNLLHVSRCGTHDDAVGRWLGNQEHFAVDSLEQTDRLTGDQLLSDDIALRV